MDTNADFLHVVEKLYASVTDDVLWSEALIAGANHCGAHCGVIYIESSPLCHVMSNETFGIHPEVQQLLTGEMAKKEVRLNKALHFRAGEVIDGRALMAWKDFVKTEIYAAVGRPYDLAHLIGAFLARSPARHASVSFNASHAHGEFKAEELNRLGRLLPHMMRAHELRVLTRRLRQAQQITQQVLESLPFGVALLDAEGSVLEITEKARALFASKDAIHTRVGRLHALNPEDDARLQRAIGLAGLERQASARVLPSIALRRSNGGKSVIASVIPFSRDERMALHPIPSCGVLLVDLEQHASVAAAVIAQSFSLTPAEARLAAYLFTGETLVYAASAMGLSYNTCKSQLRSIYEKSNTRTQAGLVKALTLAVLMRRSTE